jgi:hypothetical protein
MSNPLMIAKPQKDSNVEIIQKHIFYLRLKSTFTFLKQSTTTQHTKPDLHRLTGPIMSKSCKSNFIYIYMSSPS